MLTVYRTHYSPVLTLYRTHHRWRRVLRHGYFVIVCLPYTAPTTDGDEYCGVLNAAENCVLDGNAGWVCA